ncbi:hypothetical protein IQ268_28920 [Oculatella sp. LEGE 06141]|uniref:hypothetical protein n=1 Tax=Oculatella sp. LEGE 06141 TaxID=1828648 RepID=UPI001880C652|nr:hypothetical protein [Oculatella sp. LEGE 06141]MBE9182577.1 hypothetical protein [Oculatella sp. LEGE 06141]
MNRTIQSMLRSLHLGTPDSERYKDWIKRTERRREINLLESRLDKVERLLQTLR